MSGAAGHIHHIALQMRDINQSVPWNQSHFMCDIVHHDESWTLLKFANVSLSLALSKNHPPHFAITREDLEPYGTLLPHRDGTSSVYIKDSSENHIEMLKLAQ